MKKLLIIILIFSPIISFAQTSKGSFTLDQMIILLNMKPEDLNDYLISNGWKFSRSYSQGSREWTFNHGIKGKYSQISQSYYLGPSSLYYDFDDIKVWSNIKTKAKAYKMVPIKNGTDVTGAIYTDYMGANYVLKFMTNNNFDGTGTDFSIWLIPKKNYKVDY